MEAKRFIRGDFVGTTKLGNISQGQGTYKVFVEKNHFGLSYDGKFIKHVKASVLRAAGIFIDNKKVYGRFGYVGCPNNL